MQAYQSTVTHGSGTSFIGGYPDIVSHVEDFSENFIGKLGNHIDALIEDAASALRQEAQDIDVWSPYSGLLDVSIDRGTISYTHTGTLQDDFEMSMLEFGGPQSAPVPLLRSFAIQHTPEIAANLSKRISQEVPLA